MKGEYVPHFAQTSHAQIIENTQDDDIVVADILCDAAHGYRVDASGERDSTEGIRAAVNDCFALGGGTVHLPAGRYRITSRIEIPPFVCLHGVYGDPDCTTDHGTVILCDVMSTYRLCGKNVNVFRMAGSSALIGLTFCYPAQDGRKILPYGYTIEIPGRTDERRAYMFTLKDLTFLNAYRGICCSLPLGGADRPHEQLFLENIKGTFLRNAMWLTNSSEVGAFHRIEISPRFWLNAAGCRAPEAAALQRACGRNLQALIFGDLEWQQIGDVFIDHCRTGIEFRKGDRVADPPLAFIGGFHNLRIENCTDALIVHALYIRLGIEFAHCRIAAQRFAVVNLSPPEEGQLHFSGCDIQGKIHGPNIYFSVEDRTGACPEPRPVSRCPLPRRFLYNVLDYGIRNDGKTDCTALLQLLLDRAESEGGGVVYFPAGRYLLRGTVRAGVRTQLRGAGMHITKDLTCGYCLGTTFLCFSAPAFLLHGDGCSLCSVKIIYPEQNVYLPERFSDDAEIVSVCGNGCAVCNVYFVNANRGIRFTDCKDFLCKRVMGGFFRNMIAAERSDGMIDTCLANAIAVYFTSKNVHEKMAEWDSGLPAVTERVYPFSRKNHVLLQANSCRICIRGLFTYGSNTFIRASECEIDAVNVGFDSQPPQEGCCFDLSGSKATVYNLLRDACGTRGELFRNQDSCLTLYNMITLVLNNAADPDCDLVGNTPRKKQ